MYLSTHWSGFLGLERLFKLRAAIEAQYQWLNTNSRRNRLLFGLARRWQATAYTPDPHESWSKYPDRGTALSLDHRRRSLTRVNRRHKCKLSSVIAMIRD